MFVYIIVYVLKHRWIYHGEGGFICTPLYKHTHIYIYIFIWELQRQNPSSLCKFIREGFANATSIYSPWLTRSTHLSCTILISLVTLAKKDMKVSFFHRRTAWNWGLYGSGETYCIILEIARHLETEMSFSFEYFILSASQRWFIHAHPYYGLHIIKAW